MRATTLENFEVLFAMIVKAQRAAVRKNGRERVRSTVRRFRAAFLRDRPATALRRDASAILDVIEGQLSEVTDETEEVRAAIRRIRADFKLADEPASPVADFDGLKDRSSHLTYQGLGKGVYRNNAGNTVAAIDPSLPCGTPDGMRQGWERR